jgi:hypothetical protein
MIRYFWIRSSDIAYTGHIIESYEDLAVMTTVKGGKQKSLLVFRGPDDMSGDFEKVVQSLIKEGVDIQAVTESTKNTNPLEWLEPHV